MTDENGYYNWQLHCSGMEIYCDLVSSSFVSLHSEANIESFGQIAFNKQYIGNLLVQCKKFSNFGNIDLKHQNAEINIDCIVYEDEGTINPKPRVNKAVNFF